MTPEWALKVSGSYTIPVIETDLGMRLRWDSGRAIFATQGVPIWASWMSYPPAEGTYLGVGWGDQMVAVDPNDPDWLDPTTVLDLSVQKSFRLGKVGQLGLSFDALNALNEGAPDRVVYTSANYGLVSSLVWPRTYRFGVKFSF
jgi:hypothetical protein